MRAMYRVSPHPLGGYMFVNENGTVIYSGPTITALKLNMRLDMERGETSPFVMLYDEYGTKVLFKDYVKGI